MADFQDSLEHALRLLTRNKARINTFLDVAKTGMPSAQRVLHERIDNYLDNIEDSNSSSGANSFVDYVKTIGSAAYADDQVHDAQSAVDAAALIFLHAVVDDCAMRCCIITAMAKPQDWEHWVDERQASLKEIRDQGYDSLFDKALKKRLSKLEHESLLDKADMIQRLCKPQKDFKTFVKGYVYDRDRLSQLDNQRHRLIHDGQWAELFQRNDDDLEYLYETGFYFIDLVSFTYSPRDLRRKGRDVNG